MTNWHIGEIAGAISGLITIVTTIVRKTVILYQELQTLKSDIGKLRADLAQMHETIKAANPKK
jgi:outer membrane murein-binding lipoprotein Lpp